jgi:hypothetical protein
MGGRNSWDPGRSAARGAAVALACLLLAALVAAPAVAAQRRQSVDIEVHFRRLGPGGTEITEKGTATGTYPGPARTRLVFSGNKMTGNFSLRTTGGTVRGRIDAHVVGSSARPLVQYAGTATIAGGTGRFRTASGTLEMNGTMRRINNAINEKTVGTIDF